MDESEQLYERPDFWRKFIFWGFVVLFVVAFWVELSLTFRVGWAYFLAGLSCILSAADPGICSDRWGSVQIDEASARAMRIVAANLIVYVSVSLLAISQAAQFALPVRSYTDRWKAFDRLLRFLRGRHGPAIFVKEGVSNARLDESQDVHPGVALVDLSSSVVLEQQQNTLTWKLQQWKNDQDSDGELVGGPLLILKRIARKLTGETPPFVRVAGPGVVFTEWGEKVHSVVDLRKQVRTQMDTQAFTRDGIELKMPVFAVFSLSEAAEVIPVAYIGGQEKENLFGLKLDEKKESKTVKLTSYFELDPADAAEIHGFVQYGLTPVETRAGKQAPARQLKTPYPFHENRVFAAAYSQALVSAADPTPWHELPQRVAVDAFRSEMEKYNFDDLNQSSDPNAFPLPDIKDKFSRRVRFQGLLSYKLVQLIDERDDPNDPPQWNGRPFEQGHVGKTWQARELRMSPVRELFASKVLRDRGIKVIAAGFPEFRLADEAVKQKLVDSWKARWEKEVDIADAQYELQASRERSLARAKAQSEMTQALTDLFQANPHTKEALMLRIFQTLEKAAASNMAPKEVLQMLHNLHSWVLRERQEFDHRKREKSKGADTHWVGNPHESPQKSPLTDTPINPPPDALDPTQDLPK